jgi:hypothetical protein
MEMTKGKPVHTRKIKINAFDLGDQQVLVEGELLDTRPVGSEEKGEGLRTIHRLFARIRVQGPDLTITHVDAEMKRIPREGCPEALPAVQKLAGLRIISGYTQRVKDLIGDVKGCSHLTSLFLTMGPVAVQGYFAAYGRKGAARTPDNPAFARLLNSCHVWRDDGPFVRSLMGALKKGEKEV